MSKTESPAALLFTAPGCPHCPGVKTALEQLRDEGKIASLEVVSVPDDPARAEVLGVRSVPWLRLGEFILTGAQTPQQLRQWAALAADSAGMRRYLRQLLTNGELAVAETFLLNQPQHLHDLLTLLEEDETPIQVRLGVAAIIEGLEGSEQLASLLPRLIEMSQHTDHRLRSDACHFLGLSHHPQALAALETRIEDDNAEVREIAGESIALLQETRHH